jgi:hypothetical protein
MEVRKMKVVELCGDKKCCPVVELDTDVVRIGEAGNLCTLKLSEWKTLVEKIRSRELE